MIFTGLIVIVICLIVIGGIVYAINSGKGSSGSGETYEQPAVTMEEVLGSSSGGACIAAPKLTRDQSVKAEMDKITADVHDTKMGQFQQVHVPARPVDVTGAWPTDGQSIQVQQPAETRRGR